MKAPLQRNLCAWQCWMLLILVLTTLPSTTVHAQVEPTPVWNNPQLLTDDTTSAVASMPDLAVDSLGNVHIIWSSVLDRPTERGSGVIDTLVYRARTDGVWSAPEPIYLKEREMIGDTSSPLISNAAPNNPTFMLRGALTAAPDSHLHILVHTQANLLYLNAPWHDVARTLRLLPPSGLGEGSQGVIAAGNDGTIHTAFAAIPRGAERPLQEGQTVCTVCVEILYRRSDDGMIWTRAENLSRLDGHDRYPQLVVDPQGVVHLLWEHQDNAPSGAGTYLLYRRSTDGGLTWGELVQLGAPAEDSLQGALAVAHNGVVVVVYGGAQSGSIFYQFSPDRGNAWSAPMLVPGVMIADPSATDRQLRLAADSVGRFHLLAIGTEKSSAISDPQLLHLSWNGQNWSPTGLVPSSGAAPRNPQLRIERGNRLHAVWQTTISNADQPPQQMIWYSSGQLEAPPITPVPTFTPLPDALPTPTPTSLPTPTATLLPVEARQMDPIKGPPRWEAESLPILFLAMGPVVLLAGLLIWRVRRRERSRG